MSRADEIKRWVEEYKDLKHKKPKNFYYKLTKDVILEIGISTEGNILIVRRTKNPILNSYIEFPPKILEGIFRWYYGDENK